MVLLPSWYDLGGAWDGGDGGSWTAEQPFFDVFHDALRKDPRKLIVMGEDLLDVIH